MQLGIVTHCLHASRVSNDTVDTFNNSADSSDGDGDDCSTTNLSCASDPVEKPAICDFTANISYAIDIYNRFSSLPIKQISMAQSGIQEISVPPVDVHSINPTLDRVTPLPSFQPLAQKWFGNQQQQHAGFMAAQFT